MVDFNQVIAEFTNSIGALAINLWVEFVRVIPGIIVAIILVFVGWVLARIIKQVVIKILQSTKVDQWIDEQNLTAAIGGKEVSALVGSLTKWYVIGIFLAQAVEMLELETFRRYLVLLFIEGPGESTPVFFALLGAVIVVMAGLLAARYVRNIIEATTFRLKKTAGLVAEAIVLIFTGVLALTLIVGPETSAIIVDLLKSFIDPFIQAFAYMLAVVVGISLLVNSKADLKKISDELKKAIR